MVGVGVCGAFGVFVCNAGYVTKIAENSISLLA